MRLRWFAKTGLAVLERRVAWPVSAVWARFMALGIRPPAMIGAYPDRDTAIARVPEGTPSSYDDEEIAPVNFEVMCETRIWDYPVIFWLERVIGPGLSILDAGGHFGTKYIAFRDRIDLSAVDWCVYDVPAIVRGARKAQGAGLVPGEISFIDDLSPLDPPDILLASGLLQYLDMPFGDLVARLAKPPTFILLNKVATREGPTVVTLEKIGKGRVPYQIRNRADFERSLVDMGYVIRDTWEIPSLSHRIATHPSLGHSTSRGYVLERAS